MLSSQEEQILRKRTLENDRRVREQQGTTMHAFAQADVDIGGRYPGALGTPHIVGSTAVPIYPAAPAHQSDPVGLEPPNPEPLELRPEAQGNSGDAVDASSSGTPLADDVERTASPSSSGDPAVVHFPSPPGTSSSDVNAGSLPFRRLR